METPDYFILKRTALDGKIWWCVCYHDLSGKLRAESRHKLKREAEAYKRYLEMKIFRSVQSDLKKYNYTRVRVIRELTEEEADISEVGKMYKIQFMDGFETDAFEDELI